MTFPDFEKLIKQRRSVRYFADTPVTKEQVMKLLEAAHLAPSVQNTQPWHFHVIFNREIRRKLTQSCCYGNFVEGGGAFVIVTCDRSTEKKASEVVWNPRELEYSCMAAMMQVILGATAMGLGSCWVSMHHGEVHELLQLPLNHTAIGGVMLGHLKSGEETSAEHFERKPLADLVTLYE